MFVSGRRLLLSISILATLLAIPAAGSTRAYARGATSYANGSLLKGAKPGLNPCLVGTWYVHDYVSFWEKVAGQDLQSLTSSGLEGVRYYKNGHVTIVASHFKISGMRKTTGVPVSIELNGQGGATWRTPTKTQILYSQADIAFTEILTVGSNSHTVSMPDSNLISAARPLRYACGKYFLELWQLSGYPPTILAHSKP